MTATQEKTGKGKYGDRKSLMVFTVDSEALAVACRQVVAAQYGCTIESLADQTVPPLVAVANPKTPPMSFDRDLCIVGTEGVGWEADDYGLIGVPFGGFVTQSVKVSTQVIAKCVTIEQVDLADFVRVFGDRLESNFWLWYSIATEGRAKKD